MSKWGIIHQRKTLIKFLAIITVLLSINYSQIPNAYSQADANPCSSVRVEAYTEDCQSISY